MKRESLKERGITLVALVVTIIILLILAGVTISLVVGQGGLIQRARNSTKTYNKSSDAEYLQQLGDSYTIDKINDDKLTLEDFLAKQDRIDEVENNGDGTLNVTIGDNVYTIKDDGTEITKSETVKGALPQVSYDLFSDAAGTSKIDTTKKYDNEYIGVKIANASAYTSLTLVLTNSSEKEITTTSISGFDGYYEATNNGTYTLKVTGTDSEGTRTKTQKIIVKNLDELPGSTILRKNAPIISVKNLKYADIDNDGKADGIIVADLSKDSTDTTNTYKGGNPWKSTSGGFSYNKQETGLKQYNEDNTFKYKNTDGSEVEGTLVTCTNNSGNSRYYILSLGDFDANIYCWYAGASGKLDNYNDESVNDFGQGKEFTNYNLEKWNDTTLPYGTHNSLGILNRLDMWGMIQDKVNDGWFVPSRAEWSAFASYLQTSSTSSDDYYYGKYGLNGWYWTSAKHNASTIYAAYLGNHIDAINPYSRSYLRLVTTF